MMLLGLKQNTHNSGSLVNSELGTELNWAIVALFAVTFGHFCGGAVKMYKNLLSVPTQTQKCCFKNKSNVFPCE